MKVLIVVTHFPPHLSGLGVVAEQQAKRLASLGYEVSVLTSDCSSKPGKEEREGYVIYRVRASNFLEDHMGAPYPIFSPTILYKARKLAKESDVIHLHDSFYISSFVVAFWAKLYRKPFVVTQHIAIIPHPSAFAMLGQKVMYKTAGKFVLRNSKKVIILNDRVKQFIINLGIPTRKIANINNGVDFNVFYPVRGVEKSKIRSKYRLPDNKVLALFVGRFVPKKGFLKLMDALSGDYAIVFVGGERPRSIKFDGRTYFLGALPQLQTAEAYKACDIFILPSEGEGFPLSVQEAMASGLPVVTSNDRGYDSYAFDENLLFLIKPEAVYIKSTLTRLAKDEMLRKCMGEYSYMYAKEHFSWEDNINKLTTLYGKLTV
ncbi:MAG TPA: glycosyltransferase family 4 protein [Candidatus Sulfotelmatobacter sp.]|nr:glycosyltransferase family 4 protein [Candidatus Sulfotelmatobacter sp.]